MGAVSAVDIALWDIKGKHFEVPVWELLGGNVRDKIRLHLLSGGSTQRPTSTPLKPLSPRALPPSSSTRSPRTANDKGQARMIQTAIELTAAAREAGGPDLDLIIELHRKLTPMVSIALAEASSPSPSFPRRPDPDRQQLGPSHIAQKSTVPFGNGERFVSIWEFRELLEQCGPQYLRPDVALAGGISHCKKIAAIGEAYHCAVVTHNFLGR